VVSKQPDFYYQKANLKTEWSFQFCVTSICSIVYPLGVVILVLAIVAAFAGVNPLIYTVIAVFLLGTLAVVAIVTCWIRARRSFYRRNQIPQYTTPRDYFDGISDSDFTPITASQFYASLRDAPPTYHESEVIQASLREERDTNNSSPSEQPPPLPPRNLPRRQTPNSGQETSTRLSPARQDDEDDEDFLLLPTSSLLDSAIPPMDAQM